MRKRLYAMVACTAITVNMMAQFNESGISAGFFDSSEASTINFSQFHLPPLAVLFENAKSTPTILSLAKAQEIAQAEVAKQKRHIFSYISGHASYSYGKTDMWGNNSSTYNQMIYQFQGSEQSYWNVGVSLAVPVEDILDLGAAVKRKRLLVEQAQIQKDVAYDQLKLQIATLYVKITNDLVSLKAASENAAIYQGAGALDKEEFENGNMTIRGFADTKRYENDAVNAYQSMQTSITTDILTLEILTHTPIITNTTTDIVLDGKVEKSKKQLEKERKEADKKIKKESEAEEKRIKALEEKEKEEQEAAAQRAKDNAKKAQSINKKK